MIHPGEGVLQAFIDGELAADERSAVATHLEECAACRAQAAELRAAAALFAGALARVDAAPDLGAAREALTARPARPAAAPARKRPVLRLLPGGSARPHELRRAFLRAAVLVLLAAGGASAALPGGAVRRFLVGLWHQTTRLFTGRPAAPGVAASRSMPAPTPAPPAPPSGVSVLPQDGQVRIVVRDPARGLRVRVRLIESDRASVEAAGAASNAHFQTGPGRIEVSAPGAGDLRIGLPRGALHATVEVDGKPAFSKDGAELRHFVPVGTAGNESVYQVRP